MDAVRYTRNYKIPANSSLHLDISGEAIKHLRGDDNLKIAFDHGTITDFALGVGYNAGSISKFSQVTLYNETSNEVQGEFTWGNGDVDNDSIVFASALPVRNENGAALNTNDVDTQAILSTIDGVLDNILGNLNSINGAKKPVIDMTNAVYKSYWGNVALTTIVSAGANTNGVLIHTASVAGSSASNQFGQINIGNDIWIQARGNAGACHENIFIPAGKSISVQTSGGYGTANIAYTIL